MRTILPSFTHISSVNGLREWGEKNGCYRKVPSSGKASYIAQNIKPGDIMIEKNGGKSHTGIVTKVNSDGSFETVEGSCKYPEQVIRMQKLLLLHKFHLLTVMQQSNILADSLDILVILAAVQHQVQ